MSSFAILQGADGWKTVSLSPQNMGAIMSQPDRFVTTNTLLAALSDADIALLAPHFTRVPLERHMKLVHIGAPIEHVYFPEGGVGSIVARSPDRGVTEVGIFGREGVSATCLLLGADRSPHETFMQVAGDAALRIPVVPYLAAIRQSVSLQTVLLRYVQTFMVQAAQSTATNAHVRVEARLARWLLMAHDRVEGDEIALTHEFMGMMIAAERSSVTVSLHILEGAGMIWSKRGRVVVRDRDMLEDMAGSSYGVPEAEYRALIGPLGRGTAHRHPDDDRD